MSNLSCSTSTPSPPEYDSCSLRSMSSPSRNECNGSSRCWGSCWWRQGLSCLLWRNWLAIFCAIYDGFNGRVAVDFLAGTLCENLIHQTNLLDSELKKDVTVTLNGFYPHGPFQYVFEGARNGHVEKSPAGTFNKKNPSIDNSTKNGPFPDSLKPGGVRQPSACC